MDRAPEMLESHSQYKDIEKISMFFSEKLMLRDTVYKHLLNCVSEAVTCVFQKNNGMKLIKIVSVSKPHVTQKYMWSGNKMWLILNLCTRRGCG
jgi:hypothetical protein